MVGIVLLAIGALLVDVAVVPEGPLPVNDTQSVSQSHTLTGVKIDSPIMAETFQITWSSNSPGLFIYGVCNEVPDLFNFHNVTCTTNGTESGTGGTVTASGGNGNYLILLFFPTSGGDSNASASAKATMPTAGVPLAGLGLILVVGGVVLKGNKPPRSATSTQSPPPVK